MGNSGTDAVLQGNGKLGNRSGPPGQRETREQKWPSRAQATGAALQDRGTPAHDEGSQNSPAHDEEDEQSPWPDEQTPWP